VRFSREIKATIEIGHANHLANDVASVAYWYADQPTRAADVPPVQFRQPILRDNAGKWLINPQHAFPGKPVTLSDEMKVSKQKWAEAHK
jgi:hypothetical protein